VQAIGDGQVDIIAKVGERAATVSVSVKATKSISAPDFVVDVLPVLTRIGCNSGSCHGALAGKGGLKLSLRGYDPETDRFALACQALGRRIDRMHPEQSLMLLKPTRGLPHGGGKKFDIESEEYRRILEWVKAGVSPPDPKVAQVVSLEVL